MSRLPQAAHEVQNAQSPSKISTGTSATGQGYDPRYVDGNATTGCASTTR